MKKKLSRDDEALLALAREKGLRGVRESDIQILLPLSGAEMAALAQNLEQERGVRILAFSPLFLVSRESLEHLERRIVSTVARFHQNHPGEGGVPLDKIKKRFDAPERILRLALKILLRDGRLRQEGNEIALADHVRRLPPREEKLLEGFENLLLTHDPLLLTAAEAEELLNLGRTKIQGLIDVLKERGKIVFSPGGFIIHARRLADLTSEIRGSGRKALTVAEFKSLTGLSRKYAIPLLELLDELEITRRRGSAREIL